MAGNLNTLNSVLKYGVIGFAGGLAVLTYLLSSSEVSPVVLAMPLATFAGGAIIGLIRAKRS